MARVPFHKYSAYGNTFVVLDELSAPCLSELEKSSFAPIALDGHAGVGADNLLVVQPYTSAVLREIQQARGYWAADTPPLEGPRPELVFRMFEPDGSEALCCGNGLLCVALHLDRVHQIERCAVLTEVPSGQPRVRTIGAVPEPRGFEYEVRIGAPRALPPHLMDTSLPSEQRGPVSVLRGLVSHHSRGAAALPRPVTLDGFATFTGEPHLVVLEPQERASELGALFAEVMGKPEPEMRRTVPPSAGLGLNPSLLHELGLAVNHSEPRPFPEGVNLSFARLRPEEGLVEYRCFERGVYRETLACGTAAVAISVVLRQLGRVDTDTLRFWPKRSRDNPFYADARVEVSVDEDGLFWLRGQARRVFEAELRTSEYPEMAEQSRALRRK